METDDSEGKAGATELEMSEVVDETDDTGAVGATGVAVEEVVAIRQGDMR